VPKITTDTSAFGGGALTLGPWSDALIEFVSSDDKIKFKDIITKSNAKALVQQQVSTAKLPGISDFKSFLLSRNFDSMSNDQGTWAALARKAIYQLQLEKNAKTYAKQNDRPVYLPAIRDPSGRSMFQWLVDIGVASTTTFTQLNDYNDLGDDTSVVKNRNELKQVLPEIPDDLCREYFKNLGILENDYVRLNRRGVEHMVDTHEFSYHPGLTEGTHKDIIRIRGWVPASYKAHNYMTQGFLEVDRSKGSAGVVTKILKMHCLPSKKDDPTLECKNGRSGQCTHCNALLMKMRYQLRGNDFSTALDQKEFDDMQTCTEVLSKWMDPGSGNKYPSTKSVAYLPVNKKDHRRMIVRRAQVGTDASGGRLNFNPLPQSKRSTMNNRYTPERVKARKRLYEALKFDALDQKKAVQRSKGKEERKQGKRMQIKLPPISPTVVLENDSDDMSADSLE
jgi:hypothetical protein